MQAAIISLLATVALGWDPDGHAAIGMTVMSGLKGEALTQLKRLLNGKDVVDTAGWSHSVIKKYPEVDSIFYQLQDRNLDQVVNCSHFNADEGCNPRGHCLVTAAQYFYIQLMGRPDLGPQHFVLPVNLQLTDADNLKFLIAILGELHSPLRFGYVENKGGKLGRVQFVDGGKIRSTSLFQYWDSELIQKMIRDRPNFWYSGWTHLNSLGRGFYEKQYEIWNSNSTDLKGHLDIFGQWATESFGVMCSRVQRKAAASERGAADERSLLIPEDFSNTAANIFMDFEFLKTKILTAGIRTSIVLNFILASRDAKKLRQGSGVKIAPPRADSIAGSDGFSSLTQWTQNLAINIVIISLVALLFALFIRYTSGVTRSSTTANWEPKMKT